MKNNFSRLMFCLAALDLKENELRRLMEILQSMPVEEISARVSLLRRDSQYRDSDSDKDIFIISGKSIESKLQDLSVGERVERLLKSEAGLTTHEAVKLLASRLVEAGLIVHPEIPSASRKSIRDWVNRISQKVSAKDILRYATILRNEYVHGPIRDWKLSRSEK
jgi:hypothetical protein